MADDPRQPSDLAPDEVAARVAAILDAAERDATAIVAAARREVFGVGEVVSDPPAQHHDTNGSDPRVDPTLRAVLEAVEVLAARLDHFETTVKARFDVLWRAVSKTRAEPLVEENGEEAAARSDPPASAGKQVEGDGRARAEYVRAVELALRGFSREQIAAELRFSLPSEEIKRLLDEVLESP
jgi:hypothetical protein